MLRFPTSYQWGCIVAGVPAQQSVEQFKNTLQNITTDRMLHIIESDPNVNDINLYNKEMPQGFTLQLLLIIA